jgi:hydrogenase 3 maturation protease
MVMKETLNASWQEAANQALQKPCNGRLAIVGVGHELRGDDAAGLAVARALQGTDAPDRLVIVAGHAPENHTGAIRRFAPDLVLLVDAAQMDAPPGTVRWLSLSEIDGLSASSHTLPLSLLAHYLAATLGCQVALLGIQPLGTEIGAPLSPAVAVAVTAVTTRLSHL